MTRSGDRPVDSDTHAPRAIGCDLWIAVGLAGVVAHHDFIVVYVCHIFRQYRNLASSTWGVDDVVGYGQPRGVTSQGLDDFETFFDSRPEVVGSLGQVGLIDVIRPDTDREELLHEFLHHRRIIVDTLEQNSLAPDRNTGIDEHPDVFPGDFIDFTRVVEVGVDVKRVVLLENRAKFRRDPLRKCARHPTANPEDLDVWDRAELSQKPIDSVVWEHHRVAAGDDDVTDFRVRPDVLNSELQGFPVPPARFAYLSLSGAEPAIDGALVIHKEENTVGVPVRQVRDRTVSILIKRIVWTSLVIKFSRIRHNLSPDGISRLLDQAEVIGVDADAEILADLLGHFLIDAKALE